IPLKQAKIRNSIGLVGVMISGKILFLALVKKCNQPLPKKVQLKKRWGVKSDHEKSIYQQ
ncbi:hypothetical protein, partial [Shewanella saliphila]|uniref:hypothetical protein n=1 Tax=Shewanella saliphila TaxID=2282698 RepID=UPI00200C4821